MRVLYDNRWSGPHGIGRFSAEVRRRIGGQVFELSGAHPVSPLGLIQTEARPQWRVARHRDVLFFSPGYTPSLSWRGQMAFTVHDLIHLDVAEESSRFKSAYYDQVVKRALRHPEMIALTVSRFSQQRIADWAGIDPDRLVVVGNGVDGTFSADGEATRRDRPYVLHVGNTKPHKNLRRLVQAMAELPDLDLVLSAKPEPELIDLAGKLRMADRLTFCSGIPEAELPQWYRGAAAVAICSLYEGFGLPALEGMASGVPVVASQTTSLAEVVGDAGVQVDPLDVDAIRDGLRRAVTDDQLRAQLAIAGPARAAEFSWDAVGHRVNTALGLPPRPDHRDPVIVAHAAQHRPGRPRVAIAHDYLTQRGGAERVAAELAAQFPDAPIVTSVYDPEATYPPFRQRKIITSVLNRIGLLRRNFRLGLPLFGMAFDNTAIPADVDVVICSSTGFAHGVRTQGATKKLVYCHSPARFIYLVEDYLGRPWWQRPIGWGLMALRPALLAWDKRAAATADRYLCNSTVVAERIKSVYGIDATVVHPPNSLDSAGVQEPIPGVQPGFFLVVSRLMPYKNVDVVLDAFAGLPDQRVVIIGRGPLRDQLRAQAPGNARFFEGLSDAQMRWAYANCQAVIAPSREDFGLTPVEGFGFGKPTLAVRAGGYLDTVVPGRSGLFFDSATPEAIRACVRELLAEPLPVEPILEHAELFSTATFAAAIRQAALELVGSDR